MGSHRLHAARGLLTGDPRAGELRRQSIAWPSWTVSGSALLDLEALLAGWLSPLQGYASALEGHAGGASGVAHRVAPVLEVSTAFAEIARPGVTVALRDAEGVLLATLHVDRHEQAGESWRLLGSLEGVELPAHAEFKPLRLSPTMVAERAHRIAPAALAYFAADVLHAGIRAALVDAAKRSDSSLVVLIPSGGTDDDAAAGIARIRAARAAAHLLPPDRTVVCVVPMASADLASQPERFALFANNCGASVLALDVMEGAPSAVTRVHELASSVGLSVLGLRPWGWDPAARRLAEPRPGGPPVESPPRAGDLLAMLPAAPSWLLSDAEIEALMRAHPPRRSRGFAVFFTGLSGSGKSTIARALRFGVMEATGRPVTLLDGDRVRQHLSSELGFSRAHRDLNILRIGWVAAEIVRHGGIAICAPIAPYDAIRKQVRRMIEPLGGFLLVHVATPLETCEARDRKGLYARARAGLLENFTGISDPYESPADAAVTIDTRDTSVDEACLRILSRLESEGYVVQEP